MPKKYVKGKEVKVFERTFTSEEVKDFSRVASYKGEENVVRVARCMIPDNEEIFEKVQDWLSKYGEDSWLHQVINDQKKKSSGDWEFVCTGYGSFLIRVWTPEHGWEWATTWGCVSGYWSYVPEEDTPGEGGGDTGGNGPFPPCDDPTMPCEDDGGPVDPEICKPYEWFNSEGECENIFPDQPCLGDPIKNPDVTKSNGWNKEGGTFGFTRDQGTRFHDGIDISSPLNSNLFAANAGEVTAVVDSLSPGEFKRDSYGNYIEIKSIIDGNEVYMRYAHLNGVNVSLGDQIYAGEKIGITGDTGNAQSTEEITVLPHVHVKAELGASRNKVNPNQYMATKFNNDGTVNQNESTCN